MTAVFVNRTLNLKRIKYIGVDMDHTLVRYHTEKFEALAHRIMCDKLIANHSYPQSIGNLTFDFDAAIRGLVIDRVRGNVLKLSRHAAIRSSQHGFRQLDFNEQRQLYSSFYVDLRDPEYDTVDTAFSLSYCHLYMQLVDLKDSHPEAALLPSYQQIAQDLLASLDEAHRDGSLKRAVAKDLNAYIVQDPDLVRRIKTYRRHGKEFFVLTNSEFYYTKLLLDFAITPFLEAGESWLDLFRWVICDARKPRFFYEQKNFECIDPATGNVVTAPANMPPGCYQGGNAQLFTDSLSIDPDEILYVGDHIYGDIVRLKKDCGWRTALVVEELANEVQVLKASKDLQQSIDDLMNEKLPIERQLDALIAQQIEDNDQTLNLEISRVQAQVKAIDSQISPLIKRQHSLFNSTWGEVFRVGNEESFFSYQVDRFACVYMPTLKDLLDQNPRTYFRAHRRTLPHER